MFPLAMLLASVLALFMTVILLLVSLPWDIIGTVLGPILAYAATAVVNALRTKMTDKFLVGVIVPLFSGVSTAVAYFVTGANPEITFLLGMVTTWLNQVIKKSSGG